MKSLKTDKSLKPLCPIKDKSTIAARSCSGTPELQQYVDELFQLASGLSNITSQIARVEGPSLLVSTESLTQAEVWKHKFVAVKSPPEYQQAVDDLYHSDGTYYDGEQIDAQRRSHYVEFADMSALELADLVKHTGAVRP
jgi:hypothetical protein